MAIPNLPVQLTSFVGRERELADVEDLLSASRLVTLTGAGGSGKTRLAIQAANLVSKGFADGVWLVNLTRLNEPTLVPQLVLQSLGIHLPQNQSPVEALLAFVRSKKMLLILDNCEHLSEACTQLVQELVCDSMALKILATSREPLGIAGERIYPLSGLARPAIDRDTVEKGKSQLNLQSLMAYDAVRLFVERARAISPDFRLTSENAMTIGEICQRLDGLPLAIELASARVNVLAIQEIANRLDDRFALLTSGSRTGIEARHRTLHAAIEWSHALLSTEEQVLLRRLAVFVGGCTLDMAEGVCSGDGFSKERTLDILASLVNKSLVIAETSERAQARYHLLETIRIYGLEKLEQAGEAAQLRDRHLALFLGRAEEAAPKLGEAYQQLWLNWLEGEHDNLRAALTWALEDPPDSRRIEEGLRMAGALVRFWEIRGFIQEGLIWLERLLARTDEKISPVVRVNALVFASFLTMFLGNAPATLAYGREAVEVAEGVSGEDNAVLAFALAGLGSGARAVGDYQTAFTIGERAIQLLRGSVEPSFYLGMALLSQGDIAIQLGNNEMARKRLEESLALARQDGDAFRIAHTYNTLGDLARLEQNYAEAKTAYENSATLLRELGAKRDLASVLSNLAYACLRLEDIESASMLFFESMRIHQSQHNLPGEVECLNGLAATAVLVDLPAAGARLLAAAAAINAQSTPSAWLATRVEVERYLDLARGRLTEAEFQAEQRLGRALSLEQALAFAQKLPLKAEKAPLSEATPSGLTRREREITMLISQGMTNGEIAVELVISKRTVETHVSNILSKVGLSSRAQIIRWSIEHGLTKTSA